MNSTYPDNMSLSKMSTFSTPTSSGDAKSTFEENTPPRDFNATRYFENEALDSIFETGLNEEYLILAYVGVIRAGKIAKGALGLTSSCLQFNLINFTDVLVATEAMITSINVKADRKSRNSGSTSAKKRPLQEKVNNLRELSESSDCFFVDNNLRYRTGLFANEDGTISIARLFKDEYSKKSSGKGGKLDPLQGFEISQSSLLRFENIRQFIRFLKSAFDMCIASYSKKITFIPIVFYLFHKIMKFNQVEKEEYCASGITAVEEMLPEAVKFANNGSDYLLEDPRKFTQVVRMSPFICEEVGTMNNFFKTYYRIYNLGHYSLGDNWDVEKKDPVFRRKAKPLRLEIPKTNSAPAPAGESGKKIKIRMIEEEEEEEESDQGFFDDDGSEEEEEESKDMPSTQSF